MRETLEKIKAEALEALSSPDAQIEELRIKYLGKKGELTQVLRGMGKLSAEERPVIGQLANDVRAEIEAKISELRQEEESGEMFVRLVKRYRDFTEITQTMLNEFIDKIVIFEATGGRTVNRSQRIDIYFNFIGQFVVEDTEEEILSKQEEEKRLAELKEQERKDRRNETVRRYRQRKKEKQAAEAEAEKSRCA